MSGVIAADDVAAALGHRVLDKRHSHGRERREHRRYPLKLKVAIVYHQHKDKETRPTFHGVTSEVSICGLSVVVDRNIFNEGEVTVLLAIPPEHPGGAQKIIEATAKMTYTVHSSEHSAFRIGLIFREFNRNGLGLLRSAIARCPFGGDR